MTCRDHVRPIEDCVGCSGRWDRAMVERAIDAYFLSGVARATARMAIAEIDRLESERSRDRMFAATDADQAGKRIAALERMLGTERDAATLRVRIRNLHAQLEALRCYDLDAFSDGQLSDARAAAFRDHLARCPACEAALLGRIQEHAIVSASLERRDAVVDAAVAWVRAGGTLAALAAAVNNMEDGNG